MRYLFLLLFVCSTSAQELTIENLLSSPFPSEGIASQTVEKAAWVLNDRGKYNVWIAEGPNYKLRRLTKYTEDDGQTISDLRISKSGEWVVYVRGGSPNAAKEIPNPTSDPRGAKQQVWAIRTSGENPVLIGEGSSPDISPDSKNVIFVRDGQIYHASIDGSVKESPLFHARGRNGSPRWSPDGTRILFTSYRGDHNFIGIYDVSQPRIRWIAPSVDRDYFPVWSIDGKQIAFFRFPGSRGEPLKGDYEPSTWFSIFVADALNGEAKEIWKSPDQTGGFAQQYPDQPLLWGRSDRLIFYWEKDGWMRMYSIAISGGDPVVLSPPSCEAETATLSSDHSTLIFSSNCNDIERRHLWSVPVAGGQPKQLTQGKSVETYPLHPSNSNEILLIHSTAKQPATPAKIPFDGGEPQVLHAELTANIPIDQLVEPQVVTFRAADGLEIHGQLFLPANLQRNHPAVVYMHGGPIRQMLPAWHYYGYYHNAYAMNQFLAANGFVVLSVNFRAGIGYGRNFRRAPGQGPAGAKEYQDILAAAKFLQSHPNVDRNKIGLLGGSYGGYLTAMGLARNSDIFAAGVDFHGVHDWSLRAKLRGAEDWGIAGEELMKLAFESSPVASVASWRSPVLFVIGDDDRNVDFIETTDLIQRLRDHNRARIEMLILPDEVHGFLRYDSWVRAYRATFDFFERFLK